MQVVQTPKIDYVPSSSYHTLLFFLGFHNVEEAQSERKKLQTLIGTLRYTTARRYYGYLARKGLGKSTSRQSAKFSVRSKTNYKEAQSKEWKVTFI